MNEKKYKLVAIIQPVSPAHKIDADGGHVGAHLGKLLLKMAEAANGHKTNYIDLTREEHQQYFHGLADAHVIYARIIYDMLCVHQRVSVRFETAEVD